jgi:hypothetical protein
VLLDLGGNSLLKSVELTADTHPHPAQVFNVSGDSGAAAVGFAPLSTAACGGSGGGGGSVSAVRAHPGLAAYACPVLTPRAADVPAAAVATAGAPVAGAASAVPVSAPRTACRPAAAEGADQARFEAVAATQA